MTIMKIMMRKLQNYVISEDDSCAESSVGNEVGWAELLSGSMTTNADIRFNHEQCHHHQHHHDEQYCQQQQQDDNNHCDLGWWKEDGLCCALLFLWERNRSWTATLVHICKTFLLHRALKTFHFWDVHCHCQWTGNCTDCYLQDTPCTCTRDVLAPCTQLTVNQLYQHFVLF